MAETDNFRIYSSGRVSQLKKLARNLEDFDTLLRSLTNPKSERPPDKFDIYLVKKQSELASYTSMSKNVAGFYTAGPTGSAAFVTRARRTSGDTSKLWSPTAQQVLFHEYAHHFMLRHFPFAYPTWYIEGFAEYVSTAQFKKGKVTLGDFSGSNAFLLLNGRWLPMDILMSPVWLDLSVQGGTMFYAQSWLVTHFMLRDQERAAALTQFLARMSTRESLQQDFEASFGMPLDSLEQKLRNYMTNEGEHMTVSVYEVASKSEQDIAITKLPKSADDALILASKLDIGVGEAAQPAILKRAEKIRQKFPNDLLAQRTWALAQIYFGDVQSGRETLEALCKAHPEDAKSRFYLGLSHFLGAAAHGAGSPENELWMKRARMEFTRAFQLDNAYYPTYYFYYLATPTPHDDASEGILEAAAYLAPQVHEIRFALAEMWADKSTEAYRQQAINLYRSLASNPHGGQFSIAAAARFKTMTKDAPAP